MKYQFAINLRKVFKAPGIRTKILFAALVLFTAILPVTAAPVFAGSPGPGFPEKVFAPYVDVLTWPTFSLENTYQETGQTYYTLAFIVSDNAGRPSWGGVRAMEEDWYRDQIDFIRSVGGDVIISFGGANGTELALAASSAEELQAAYQSVIDRYDLNWVDFDIEGMAVGHRSSIDLRNKAIRGLQEDNPDLKTAFCLPVLPQGLTADGLFVIENARDNGVRIDLVNVMAMDYGDWAAPSPEGQMGTYAIDAAKNTRLQMQSINVDTWIGITPMIGQNDVPSERFYLSDAVELLNWSLAPDKQDWVGMLSMWSVNRDNGGCPGGSAQWGCSGIEQDDFAFTDIFSAFTGGEGGGNILPSVSITSPLDRQSFSEGEKVVILAEAEDADGAVMQVEFFEGSHSLGIDTQVPFTAILPNIQTGSYILTAVAVDDGKASRTSAPVMIFAGGACTALPWDRSVVYLSGDKTSYDNQEWEAKWWTQGDVPGTTGQWGVWKEGDPCEGGGGGGDENLPPTAAITSPSDGEVFVEGDEVVFSADALDEDGGILQVEFFLDSVSLGVDTAAPYRTILTGLPAGTYSLTAVALDDQEATGTSPAVQIIIAGAGCTASAWDVSTAYWGGDQVSHAGKLWAAGWWTQGDVPGTTGPWGVWKELGPCEGSGGGDENLAPTAMITSPSDGEVFVEGDEVVFSADALDEDGGILQVEFFLDSVSMDVDTAAPYRTILTGLPAGTYSLTAVALDDQEAVGASPAVQITITGAGCTASAWDGSTVYWGGDQASYAGKLWEAKWWTRNNEPGTTGQWGVWKELETCGGR
ncbi:MAG: hypothetical protein GY860_16370 [Desulfobacteraceae bacterium]|nr:hypothetical protein [Desulfobacteraceae bacterium]